MATECIEVQEWIEEEIYRPVDEWVEKTENKCKKRSRWNPLRWLCQLVTKLVQIVVWVVTKALKLLVRTVCKIVGALVSAFLGSLGGLWDVIVGGFTLDLSRFFDGFITIFGSGLDAALNLLRISLLIDTFSFVYEEWSRRELRNYVRKLLDAKYRGQELSDIKDALQLDHGVFGLRMSARAVRTYLDSETPSPTEPGVPNLIVLNRGTKINLKELCGFASTEGYWNQKRYKTLKKGPFATGGGGGEIDNPITEVELNTYIASDGAEGPKFFVFSMRDSVLETKLRAAELKGREIGLMLSWDREDVEVCLPEHINHDGDGNTRQGPHVRFLKDMLKRTSASLDKPGASAEQCKPVAAGVFRFTNTLRGLSACLELSACGQGPDDASGVTFIDNKPDIVWKYVPIHEFGHYFGLCHVDGLNRIMYSPKENSWFTWTTIPKLLLINGEPTFTLDEAKRVWDHIVQYFPPSCLGSRPPAPVIA